jgi:hypothetical protein
MLRTGRSTEALNPRPVFDVVESFEHGGLAYDAVSVEAWAARGVSSPRMVDAGAGHTVLAHPVRAATGAPR